MDSNRYSKEHVLWSFCDFTIKFEQIRALKSFESEIVVIVITSVVDMVVENICILHDDLIHFFRNQRSVFLTLWVDVFPQVSDDIGERIFG